MALHVLADVHKHQISLVDPARSAAFDGWDNDWSVTQVGVTDGMLTVFTHRADGRVPLSVRVLREEPTVDDGRWSGIVEGHLYCPSGELAVDELLGDLGNAPRMPIAPVPHRALICFGDTDSSGYDGRDGADHYQVLLWPGEPSLPRARKKSGYVDRARREPNSPLSEALSLAASDEPHERFRGITELARHGGAEALAHLLASEGEVARHHACCALGLAHPLPMDALETFATDVDPRVRVAALVVLHDALFAVDFGEREPFDPDRAYAIVRPRLSDPHPEPRGVAEAALRELDAMADDLREAAATEGEPGPPLQRSELEQAALAFLGRLADRALIETEAGFVAARAADVVVEAIAAMEHARSGLGAALADALIEVDGVVDVFATDEELEAVLREE